MALGLLLGAASGATIIVFFGTRLPRREIDPVTVTRDVLPAVRKRFPGRLRDQPCQARAGRSGRPQME